MANRCHSQVEARFVLDALVGAGLLYQSWGMAWEQCPRKDGLVVCVKEAVATRHSHESEQGQCYREGADSDLG